jgi:hypothetical protein
VGKDGGIITPDGVLAMHVHASMDGGPRDEVPPGLAALGHLVSNVWPGVERGAAAPGMEDVSAPGFGGAT